MYADVVELADTPDLGSGARACRFKSCHPHLNSINPNLLIVGDGFGFIVFEEYPNFNAKL